MDINWTEFFVEQSANFIEHIVLAAYNYMMLNKILGVVQEYSTKDLLEYLNIVGYMEYNYWFLADWILVQNKKTDPNIMIAIQSLGELQLLTTTEY